MSKLPFPQAGKNDFYKVKPLMPTGATQEDLNNAVIRQFKQLTENGDITIDPATVPGKTADEIAKMTLSEMIALNPKFRMVMKHTTGGGAADTQVTSSESMGYGMLMLVTLAGADEALGINTKEYFDGMFRSLMHWNSWIDVNEKPSRLMSWQLIQPKGAGTPYQRPRFEHDPSYGQDDDAATDGDLDMTFALFMADKQWGSDGEYDYKSYAHTMLNDIWERMIDIDSDEHKRLGVEANYHVKPGDWASADEHWVPAYGLLWDLTRPSDHMLDHFKVFKILDPVHDWQKVIDATYECIRQLCEKNSTGLLPDFAMFDRETKTWKPVPGTENDHWENPEDGEYHQNACRTPWRLGTDYLLSGKTPVDDVCIKPLNTHLKKASGGQFDKITGYLLDGTPYGENTPYYSNPPLVLAAASGDREWLDNGWNYSKNLKWHDDRYGSYLNVLALIVASGNYWLPI
ncbi:MAG: hypothetical protein LBI27_00110 [Clostridiales bacterium]|jgi:hypothetical protein|nr:hypothetical protein [Clostridiales bacterium]